MPPADDNRDGSGGAGPPARRSSLPRTVTQEQLERVIRRASDLQFRSSTSVGGELAAGEVVQIGAEVGIEERYVRQALAEVEAASLIPDAPPDEGLARRIVGSAIVSTSRVVPGSPADVEANLESYLREEELLRQVRSRSGGSLWEPGTGLVSQMRRAMDVGGRRYTLAKARNLQVSVEALESGWSLATLTADIGNMRAERIGGWFAGMGLGGAAGGFGLFMATGGGVLPLLGGLAIFSGFTAIATVSARADMRKVRQRMELALQGLLDRLERGENLRSAEEPWHRKLLR
ncbi:MAG: hypothetical protein OXI39_01605 [Gemmatimonadota bacterium]|uniref:hypothetical protein n=1 Tax=Candidatus Palauibacter scopulicola TaxID=3056741 RepID=UPI0023A264E0|nr:hypothetical protein [Candidatus Palauibacter scopulicola]MDE2661685.1 hypothetical protein [Candidatus Palauibacter scopulicola]